MAAKKIEVSQDLKFQRQAWTAQRAGWVVMLLAVVAAVAGLCGMGPAAHAEVSQGAITVEYDRLTRYQRPVQLSAELTAEAISEGSAQVWISRDYVEAMNLEKVVPEPESVEVQPDRLVYTFQAAEGGPVRITFDMRTSRVGLHEIRMGVVDGPSVSVTQVVYP